MLLEKGLGDKEQVGVCMCTQTDPTLWEWHISCSSSSFSPSLPPPFLQICTLVADKENVGDGITKCEGLGAYRALQEVREGGREEGGRRGEN